MSTTDVARTTRSARFGWDDARTLLRGAALRACGASGEVKVLDCTTLSAGALVRRVSVSRDATSVRSRGAL